MTDAHRDISPPIRSALVEPWPWGGAWIPLPDGTVLRLIDVTPRGRTWGWRALPGRGVVQRGRLSAEA